MSEGVERDEPGDLEDRALLEESLRSSVLLGDPSAWRVLFDRSYAALDAHVRSRVAGDRALADEIVQETWLVAVRRMRAFDPRRGPFAAWLRGIAGNVLRARQREAAGRADERSLSGEVPAPAAHDAPEVSARIRAALLRLPERHRLVLEAKYMKQLSVAEIAASWSVPAKTVESLLTRARDAFRRIFDAKEDDS